MRMSGRRSRMSLCVLGSRLRRCVSGAASMRSMLAIGRARVARSWLRREVAELKWVNEILRSVSAFFAKEVCPELEVDDVIVI